MNNHIRRALIIVPLFAVLAPMIGACLFLWAFMPFKGGEVLEQGRWAPASGFQIALDVLAHIFGPLIFSPVGICYAGVPAAITGLLVAMWSGITPQSYRTVAAFLGFCSGFAYFGAGAPTPIHLPALYWGIIGAASALVCAHLSRRWRCIST